MTTAGADRGLADRALAGPGGLTDEWVPSSPPAAEAESMDSWVYLQRLQGTRDGTRQIVWANSLVAPLTALLLWPTVPPAWLLGWLVLHLGVGALRLAEGARLATKALWG